MHKKSDIQRTASHRHFPFSDELRFTPPDPNGCHGAHKVIEPTPSRIGDLKPVVEKLLATLIDAVNARYAIAHILPTHGQAHLLIGSTGIPGELLNNGTAIDLTCDTCRKVVTGPGIDALDLGSCQSREDCRYAKYRIRSLVSLPIETEPDAGKSIGMLTALFSNDTPYLADRSVILQSFSGLLCALIQHSRHNRELRRADLVAQRQTIANEIHDSLAQSLAYTRMRTSLLLESIRTRNELMTAKYAHDIDDTLESSQKTVRELITNFRCAMDPSGLLHALKSQVEQFRHRNSIVLEYINRAANLELPLEYEIQVSHIVQEALTNIAAHSGATHARLIVDLCANYHVFTIEDNGCGGCTFTPVEGHYGMMIMRERARRIGGEIRVESAKGTGTRVQLYFPEPSSGWRKVHE